MSVYPPLSPWSTGFKGLCPKCGQGRLFVKFLKVADQCSNCGQDFSKEDAGDGAIPFIIFLAGFIGVGLGVWLQFTFDPPIWVQIAVTFPIIIFLVLGMMQPLKGLMIALQFTQKSGDSDDNTF